MRSQALTEMIFKIIDSVEGLAMSESWPVVDH